LLCPSSIICSTADDLLHTNVSKGDETNVPGLHVAGSVVAGKFNNKIFVENGRLHAGPIVRSIIERKGRKP
jgi:hypothetical protein